MFAWNPGCLVGLAGGLLFTQGQFGGLRLGWGQVGMGSGGQTGAGRGCVNAICRPGVHLGVVRCEWSGSRPSGRWKALCGANSTSSPRTSESIRQLLLYSRTHCTINQFATGIRVLNSTRMNCCEHQYHNHLALYFVVCTYEVVL